MKSFTNIILLLLLLVFFGGCKSTSYASKKDNKVSIEDFSYLKDEKYLDNKGIVISEDVDVRIQSMTSTPWEYKVRSISDVWTTTVEEKILIGVDNINNEQFATIEYYYPKNMRWDLMTNCEMWIYSLNDGNAVKTRKLKRDEMIIERVSDSINSIKLNIDEDMTGKILFRRYSLISPYYEEIIPTSSFAKLQSWYFQRDIPLKTGRYQILLPLKSIDPKVNTDLVQLGEGDIDIKSSFVKETQMVHTSQIELGKNVSLRAHYQYSYKQVPTQYSAQKIVATVSDVEALQKNQEPLGVEIVHRDR